MAIREANDALEHAGDQLSTLSDMNSYSEDQSTWGSVSRLIAHGSELAMIFGGVVPYIPQYLSIKRSGNTKGFSLYVCLALIIANTLRILFWFGRHFETPLLLQSILMNITMMELVRLCVNVNAKRDSQQLLTSSGSGKEMFSSQRKERIFIDFDVNYFWQWTDFQSYVEAVASFLAGGSLLMYFMLKVEPFVEMVGFLAVFTEALLGTPQFYRNFKNKSTHGMSLQMVCMWTCGDLFKTTYFYLRQAPVQFYLCGCLQVMVDLSILLQVWHYREATIKRKKTEVNMHY